MPSALLLAACQAIDAPLGPDPTLLDAEVPHASSVGDVSTGDDPWTLPARCSSGRARSPNESEGPDMMPGRACISCHADTVAATGEDAPIFLFGGTLFPTGHEPDDCIADAAEGAQVIVTDATGAVFAATANATGNFSLDEGRLVPPFRAKVVFEGRERAMSLEQTNGDCNACHSAEGEQGAPGRIVLP